MANQNNGKFASGLLFGIIIGAVTGLFLAPQTGEETRKKLQETAEDFRKQIAKVTEKLKEETNEVIEKGKSFLEEKIDFQKKEKMENESSEEKIEIN
jgi:gas vesicle protein